MILPVTPETRYARSGDVSIAYQVVGDGPFDLVFAPGFVSNVEYGWEEPDTGALLPAVPTLIVHRVGDRTCDVKGARFAEQIPGAEYVELPGEDHLPWVGVEIARRSSLRSRAP